MTTMDKLAYNYRSNGLTPPEVRVLLQNTEQAVISATELRFRYLKRKFR